MKLRLFAPSAVAALIMSISAMPPAIQAWLDGRAIDAPLEERDPVDFDSQTEGMLLALSTIEREQVAAARYPIERVVPPEVPEVQVASLDRTAPVIAAPPKRPVVQQPDDGPVRVRSGDTLMAVLTRNGAKAAEAEAAIRAVREHFDPRRLRAGDLVHVRFASADAEARQFQGFRIAAGSRSYIEARRADDGGFDGRRLDRPVETRTIAAEGTVRSSLYAAASDADVPTQIMAKMIRAYSWGVDFQRDLRPGDGFRLLYDVQVNEIGDVISYGDVHYAALRIGGKEREMVRFEFEDGQVDFFGPDGSSLRKSLLRTPVDGARVSSPYGMRRHPILGYSKMHKGIDFAAPQGTPIYAAGDGVIERIGRWGAYGHYVRIRHENAVATAYAHLSRYAEGMSRGTKVRQGQVIGYVGSTGRSTGPHLHYEVLVNGEQVNPQTIDIPNGRALTADERKRLQMTVADLRQRWHSLKAPTQLASRASGAGGPVSN